MWRKIVALCAFAIVLATSATAQQGITLNSHIPQESWPTADYSSSPYPSAWVTSTSSTSSGFGNSLYDVPTGRVYWSAPFSVGFTNGLDGSTPTIIQAWQDSPVNNIIRVFRNTTNSANGYAVIVHGRYFSVFDLSAGLPLLYASSNPLSALAVTSVMYQRPHLVFTCHAVTGGGTIGWWFHQDTQAYASMSLRSDRRCYISFHDEASATFYWGCLGGFLYNSVTNNPFTTNPTSPTLVTAGAGNFTSGVMDTSANRLYMGSSIGLGISIDMITKTSTHLFFTFGTNSLSPLRTVVLDKSGAYPALFWGTGDGRVVRVNTRDFSKVFATATTGLKDQLGVSHSDGSGSIIFGNAYTPGGSSPNNTDYHTYSLVKSNCGAYTCATCLGSSNVDKEYCGMCVSTGLCTTSSDCVDKSWTQSGVCPSVVDVTLATSGSIAGGDTSQFNGAYFTGPNPTEEAYYKCRYFDASASKDIDIVAGSLTSTSVQCVSPQWSTPGTVNVSVLYKSRVWTGNWQFRYYDCATATNCAQCGNSEMPSCGWCFERNTCSGRGLCPSGQWGAQCPIVGNATAVSASVQNSTEVPVLVPVTNFYPLSGTDSFSCLIDDQEFTAQPTMSGATMSGLNCLVKPSAFSVPASTFYTISIIKTGSPSTVFGTTGMKNLEVYNCAGLSVCYTCSLPTHSECKWCADTCQLKSGATCVDPVVCARLDTLSPERVALGTSGSVAVAGVNLNGLPTPDTCIWTRGLVTNTTTLASLTGTAASCPIPSSALAGDYTLALGTGPQPTTNSLPFTVYDCATRTTCGTCISPDAADVCQWCMDIDKLSCFDHVKNPAACTNAIASHDPSMCPSLTEISPSALPMTGGINVTLFGNHQLSSSAALNAECSFETAAGQTLTSLSWVNSSAVECEVPSVATGGATQVSIWGPATSKAVTNAVDAAFVICEEFSTCDQCLGLVGSFCTWCGATCTAQDACSPSLAHEGCPFISSISPNYSIVTGGDKITIHGGNFLVSAKRASLFQCSWDASTTTDIVVESSEMMSCLSPQRSIDATLPLAIHFNSLPYLSTPGIEFFKCESAQSLISDHCVPECTQLDHCGWCVGTASCTSSFTCASGSSAWQENSCVTATLNQPAFSIQGGAPVIATLSQPMPISTTDADVSCMFDMVETKATVQLIGNVSEGIVTGTTVTCIVPAVSAPITSKFGILYQGKKYIAPMGFVYDDCTLYKSCTECISSPNCGWCGKGNKCSFQSQCAERFSKVKCPINKVAVGVGVGLGMFGLILLLVLLVFLIRRARRKTGLHIDLKEPNYVEIAWGSDVVLMWRVPENEYRILETGLSRKDFLLQLAMAFNCPATEQDPIAKALVYIAYAHRIAADLIQSCIRFEVQTCNHENTLFRNNSVASKMYKFFSRIVGIKYLFNCIARVILELEILGRETASKKPSKNSDGSNDVSLLTMNMELDQTKALGDDIDTDTNLLQLQLICQKLLNVLIKTSVKNIPAPFRKIFVEIDNSVMARFAGSNDAVYKGIGGLFFLRFVCPAITAPHVYGLLESPPNTVTQRQLVLISKVIQSIANMQAPGKKEEYMNALSDFIVQSIPKIIKFYDNLRVAVNFPQVGDSDEQELEVPNEVRLNSLAVVWNFLYTDKGKLRTWIDSPQCPFSDEQKVEVKQLLDECEREYPNPPKKLKQGATEELAAAQSGKTKKKKTKA